MIREVNEKRCKVPEVSSWDGERRDQQADNATEDEGDAEGQGESGGENCIAVWGTTKGKMRLLRDPLTLTPGFSLGYIALIFF